MVKGPRAGRHEHCGKDRKRQASVSSRGGAKAVQKVRGKRWVAYLDPGQADGLTDVLLTMSPTEGSRAGGATSARRGGHALRVRCSQAQDRRRI